MILTGNLSEIDAPGVIELARQIGGLVRVNFQTPQQTCSLYIQDGEIVHAIADTLSGPAVVYAVLSYTEGTFVIERGVPAPRITIELPWNTLLLEGLRQLDEAKAESQTRNMLPATEESVPPQEQILTANNTDRSKQPNHKGDSQMANVKQALTDVMTIDGALAVALVDWSSGMTLGTSGNGALNIEVAAAGNTNVVRSKMKVMKDLGIKGGIEDILITLDGQYHLIRMLSAKPNLFLYVALNRMQANLGMARHQLSEIEKELSV